MKKKQEYKKGIKIVRKEDGKLWSSFSDGKEVRYKKDKWTERPKKCGPLAVFGNLEDAKDFISGGRQFWECEYVESEEKFLYAYKDYGYSQDVLIETHSTHIPYGTIFADKVKLIKQIE